MTKENSKKEHKDLPKKENPENKNPKEYIGKQVAGVWVVSGEDMPALSNYQEIKGDYIIAGGILGKQEKAITYAHPKHLKTMLEIWKGMCISTGTSFFDYPVKQSRVFYIGMEDSVIKLSNRVEKMKQHFPPLNEFDFAVLEADKRNIQQIESLIIEQKPKVIIIDPLTSLLKKEDKKEDVESLLKEFDRLTAKYEVSIILIHHARKGKGETLESMRGSSALTGWADTICRIDRRDNKKDKIKLDFECRHAIEEVEQLKLNFNRETGAFEIDSSLTSELQNKIRQLLFQAGGALPISKLKEDLEDEASIRTIERAIGSMPEVRTEVDTTDRRRKTIRLVQMNSSSVRNMQ